MVTPEMRRAAAKRYAERAAAAGITKETGKTGKTGARAALRAAASAMPDVRVDPHYYGPYANWAFSPLPKGALDVATLAVDAGGSGYQVGTTFEVIDAYGNGTGAAGTTTVENVIDPDTGELTEGVITGITLTANGDTNYVAPQVVFHEPNVPANGTGAAASVTLDPATLSGGIRKFLNRLPGLGPTGANDILQAHGAGQYIPVAIADTKTYGDPNYNPAGDYYEIAVVEWSEKMHSDLPPTRLRGYVQLWTQTLADNNAGLGKIPLYYPDGITKIQIPGPGGAMVDAFAVDYPHYLGPAIVARKDRPVRIKFYNLLPKGAEGKLFIPTDTTILGAGEGPTQMKDASGNLVTDSNGNPVYHAYTENRATLHLHGGKTPWISDGTPHQWTAPLGEDTVYPKGVSTRNVPDPDLFTVALRGLADRAGERTKA